MKLYVGNLSFQLNEESLRDAFEAHGQVESVNIVTDRETGRSRGFGFVEMPIEEEARAAIEAMHGANLMDRPLTVNEARPREDRGGFGGNRGGGRGFGGGPSAGRRGNGGGYGRY